jgi:hypothetical protein
MLLVRDKSNAERSGCGLPCSLMPRSGHGERGGGLGLPSGSDHHDRSGCGPKGTDIFIFVAGREPS